ncbi:helix-turn-helix domain-containing protein, partial [Dysosmobacter welbionis]
PPPARSKGRAHAACKAGSRLLHIGELVHLLEGEMDSGVVHQGVILPQGAGEPLDLQLRVGDGGFDGDNVLHILRLGQQVLQPLQLGPLSGQAALRVVVRLADVLAGLLLIGDVAQCPHPVQERLELVRGDAHFVVAGAIAAAVVMDRRLLKIAPQDLHQRPQVRVGGVEGGGLHLHPGGVDHLGVFQTVGGTVLRRTAGVLSHFRLRPGAVGAARVIRPIRG